YLRRGWSKTVGGPIAIGAKWSVISESRGDAMSFGPRVLLEFGGNAWGGTNAPVGHVDLVASREFNKVVELTGMTGGVFRANPDQFAIPNGLEWGVGTILGTRSRFRGLVEWVGEFPFGDNTVVLQPPYTAEDLSVAPIDSPIRNPAYIKFGGVFQAKNGAFIHAGLNYSQQHTGSRVIACQEMDNPSWG